MINDAKDRQSYVYARTVYDNLSSWRLELHNLVKDQPKYASSQLVYSAYRYVHKVEERLESCVDEAGLHQMRWIEVPNSYDMMYCEDK